VHDLVLAMTGVALVGNPPEAIITRVGWYWLPMLITSKSLDDKGNF